MGTLLTIILCIILLPFLLQGIALMFTFLIGLGILIAGIIGATIEWIRDIITK